jgi:hypothetical protein
MTPMMASSAQYCHRFDSCQQCFGCLLSCARGWLADLPVAVEARQPTCLVALGRPARRAMGGLPVPESLTSNGDISESGQLRPPAAASGTNKCGGPQLRQGRSNS